MAHSTCNTLAEEPVGPWEVPSETCALADPLEPKLTDTAGMGGDGKNMPNTSMVLRPAAVGVGHNAAKYGNHGVILASGVSNATE